MSSSPNLISTAPQSSKAPVALRPFLCAPLMNMTERWRSRRFLWLFPSILVVAGSASLIESSFGGSNDLLLIDDLKRAIGQSGGAFSPPRFLFLRDYASWAIVLAIALTFVVVHRQWKLMHDCLPQLAASGAIRPRQYGTWRPIHRLLGIQWAAERGSGDTPFRRLVDSVNELGLRPIGRANPLIMLIASLGLMLVLIHLRDNGIYAVLSPGGLTEAGRQAWLSKAYESWWAGTSHSLGLSVYFLASTVAVCLILLQNLVGVACVYIAVAMPAVLEFDADWENRDGNYGWSPMARMYRTVYLSLGLHLLTLLMLLWFLGPDNFVWLGLLAITWTVVFPLYTFIPAFVLRRVANDACVRKLVAIGADRDAALSKAGLTDAQIEEVRERAGVRASRVHEAKGKIHPLGIDRKRLAPLITGWLLPLVFYFLGRLS